MKPLISASWAKKISSMMFLTYKLTELVLEVGLVLNDLIVRVVLNYI